jgi:hypothetical protein
LSVAYCNLRHVFYSFVKDTKLDCMQFLIHMGEDNVRIIIANA